ncbi:MAG: hypothetical protein JST20_05805 [Bacteroidetes bacterium]|nr:hypothetical protein [Bacteroidota bacterium]
MKMSTMMKYFCVALIATMWYGTALAQSPDRQMGLGVTVGSGSGAAHLVYAINPGFHIGTQLGINLASSKNTSGESYSSNQIYFAPYAKLILAGMKDMKPYFFGAFGINSGGGNTTTGLSVGAGGEYFASRNVGLYGQFSIINVGFDPSYTNIGIVFPQVGIEWFFNP